MRGNSMEKAAFWSFTAVSPLTLKIVKERNREAFWLSCLKITAGYTSISQNLSYRLSYSSAIPLHQCSAIAFQ